MLCKAFMMDFKDIRKIREREGYIVLQKFGFSMHQCFSLHQKWTTETKIVYLVHKLTNIDVVMWVMIHLWF